jgi:prephenate dehydrogenase
MQTIFSSLILLIVFITTIQNTINATEALDTGENEGNTITDFESVKMSVVHDMKIQKAAVKAWSKLLSEDDYNATEWSR